MTLYKRIWEIKLPNLPREKYAGQSAIPGKDSKGFTLIEILVVSVMVAFIAFIAVNALRTVSIGRNKIDEYCQAAGEIRFAERMIHKDLANLFRSSDMKNVKLLGYETSSEAGSTSIITAYIINNIKARIGAHEGDMYEVEYFLQQKDGQSRLMRRLQPNPLNQEEPGGILTAIADNIVSFNIRYYDLAEDIWSNEWPEESEQLPQLIEVNLTGQVGSSKKLINNSFMITFPRWPG